MTLLAHAQEVRQVEFIYPVFVRLHIAQGLCNEDSRPARIFQVPKECKYAPLADDFGPVNIASVYRFNGALNAELNMAGGNQRIILKVDSGRRALSNAVFMLGAFMILEHGKTVEEVEVCFWWVDSKVAEGFRDAAHTPVDFELSLGDCWRGLIRGVQLGWIPSTKTQKLKSNTQALELEMYQHFDNSFNGDLHMVVPCKIIAFAGPVDIPGGQHFAHQNGRRCFSAAHYALPFSMLGVSDVVQLNFSTYDTSPFVANGIKVHRLPFENRTCPPEELVQAFIHIVDNAQGLVAVHCRTGRGRTGTLIARYLMRTHGFPARQALGWLRILRPGSVIGPQQHYLCALESARDAAAGGQLLRTSSGGARLGRSQHNSSRLLDFGPGGRTASVSPTPSAEVSPAPWRPLLLRSSLLPALEPRAAARLLDRPHLPSSGAARLGRSPSRDAPEAAARPALRPLAGPREGGGAGAKRAAAAAAAAAGPRRLEASLSLADLPFPEARADPGFRVEALPLGDGSRPPRAASVAARGSFSRSASLADYARDFAVARLTTEKAPALSDGCASAAAAVAAARASLAEDRVAARRRRTWAGPHGSGGGGGGSLASGLGGLGAPRAAGMDRCLNHGSLADHAVLG